VEFSDQDKWISVKDRLPEPLEWVLVGHSEDGWVDRADLWADKRTWNNGEVEVYPTHWQPLPETPKL